MHKQGKFYAFAATGFLYSTIIVDLYRKLVGVDVESIRNIVYVFFFGLLLIDMFKTKRFQPMLILGVVISVLFVFSIALNPGYPGVYISSISLFFSRLWPAYYIGRYTEDWDRLSKSVLLFSPIALAYSVSLFVIPDLAGGDAYATIASNLAFVSMIALFSCLHFKKYYALPIAIICLIPVFFYGTRVFFVGVIISLSLAYLINSNRVSPQKRALLLSALVIVAILFLANSEAIFNQLYQWFPDSRTLKMMAAGDFMDDSNRGWFYERIFSHLKDKPFSMLGLIGDRIYLASTNASTSEILSNFSHNCSLELCMNFGVPIGLALNLYFLYKLFAATKKSFKVQNTINYIFVLFLGAGFVNMMVSASYMGSYTPWLIFGLAFCICDNKALGQNYINNNIKLGCNE